MEKKLYGADVVIDSLRKHGINLVFGIPGAKIDRLFEGLDGQDSEGAPKLIVTRHEQNAAFMAQAYGRLTGKTGVAITTSGPGVGNLATGIMTANAEGDPMLAIGGQVQRKDLHRATHQSTPSTEIMAPITQYSAEIQDPNNISEIMANAFEASQDAHKGAAFVSLPQDVDDAEVTEKPLPIYETPKMGPADPNDLQKLVELIKNSKMPVILVGQRGADEEITTALRKLLSDYSLPVVETYQAAGVVSRDLEQQSYFGRIGLFRNQVGDQLLQQSDLVIAVGYDPIEYEPRNWNKEGNLRIVNLDTLPAQIDNHYTPIMQLVGNITTSLTELDKLLKGYEYPVAATEQLAKYKQELDQDKKIQVPASNDASHPLAVVHAIQENVTDDMHVALDVGSHYIWMARHFRCYQPRHLLISNGMQTLGVGLPWAMVAAMLYPEHKSVAVCGDGGFLFSGAELATAVQHHLNVVTIVWNDGGHYDMVRFQEEMKYSQAAGVKFGNVDIVKYAESFGATGLRVNKPADLTKVLSQAFNIDGPVVVDVPVDYSNNKELAANLIDSQLG
ncbi:acetolactate synthase large subunit [Limosilactobacillus reuteri]|uniref:Acetolactate synthase large subunit n=1 Tax=Limosilactobacillus reuteri TaxID=1598 RepID=A0A0U5K0U8_LIMRT|nr:acetolactate synthase AlsS [Limosilactobacillus reuteri]MDD7120152.1 acetolactate synthase AlsS [Limosilactobacillus reuteri]OTA52000.1 acetolactate synthase large subunit [Limosilactobacillus reuteri]OTA90569.1 acetolactate synthase large subunit [Limosilactobacillus reuteri]QKT16108.1 acetolactate synthase AlsS [Limosilactobacillus reuteri]CUR42559.1 Acetolactate synthase, catabolic [Limosilactobacillus reuteri]